MDRLVIAERFVPAKPWEVSDWRNSILSGFCPRNPSDVIAALIALIDQMNGSRLYAVLPKDKVREFSYDRRSSYKFGDYVVTPVISDNRKWYRVLNLPTGKYIEVTTPDEAMEVIHAQR